jgi:hypothetical protein
LLLVCKQMVIAPSGITFELSQIFIFYYTGYQIQKSCEIRVNLNSWHATLAKAIFTVLEGDYIMYF